MNMDKNEEFCPVCRQRDLKYVGWRGLGLILQCRTCGCRFVEHPLVV
jgi:RNA polymerase subunit RPABC4/transcription elongation factor Spt4